MTDSDHKVDRNKRLLLAGAVATPLVAAVAARPSTRGGAHDARFLAMQAALRDAGLHRPTLVVDRAALQHNIERLRTHLPDDKAYRIVAKSLPSLDLIKAVRQQTGTDRLMLFHQPFLNHVAEQMPDAHCLLGKPMPVGAAARFFERHQPNSFDPGQQIEWLVDSQARLAQYRELASSRINAGATPMRINLEIDVGLHRGGFRSADDVAEAIRTIQASDALQFAGLMGYEAHASKMPGLLGGPDAALRKAMNFYSDCVDAAAGVIGSEFDPDALTLNAGGSSTYQMYDSAAPCNELATGSALVMPSDFDGSTLADHKPAAYIATPVIKSLDRTEIPGVESLRHLFRAWDPNTARTFFIYGGYWLADSVSPPGLQRNGIYGHSTNQDMLNGSRDVQLATDDFVFLRPRQSEHVFLQFGDIALFDDGRITAQWPVFTQGA